MCSSHTAIRENSSFSFAHASDTHPPTHRENHLTTRILKREHNCSFELFIILAAAATATARSVNFLTSCLRAPAPGHCSPSSAYVCSLGSFVRSTEDATLEWFSRVVALLLICLLTFDFTLVRFFFSTTSSYQNQLAAGTSRGKWRASPSL